MPRQPSPASHANAPSPRTKPAAIRVDELMAAAEQLFLAQGEAATTIDEIVELAGVAKGTFYHYFDSRQALLEAMGQRYTTQYLERLEQAVQACGDEDWHQRLSAWIRTSIMVYVETWKLHDIVYLPHHRDRHGQERHAILAQLEDILLSGERAGLWQLVQASVTAQLIYAGMHAVADEVIASPQADQQALIARVTEICLRMVVSHRV